MPCLCRILAFLALSALAASALKENLRPHGHSQLVDDISAPAAAPVQQQSTTGFLRSLLPSHIGLFDSSSSNSNGELKPVVVKSKFNIPKQNETVSCYCYDKGEHAYSRKFLNQSTVPDLNCGYESIETAVCEGVDVTQQLQDAVIAQNATCIRCALAIPISGHAVCGKDGKAYPNVCLAECYGAGLLEVKKCATEGKCDCPPKVEEVCGSDGKTYGNECLATCEGVKVSAYKTCEAKRDEENIVRELKGVLQG